MPITKAAKGREPNWKEWDAQAQKSGLRHTVVCAGGDTYTGHWDNNLKNGKGSNVIFEIHIRCSIFNVEIQKGHRYCTETPVHYFSESKLNLDTLNRNLYLEEGECSVRWRLEG